MSNFVARYHRPTSDLSRMATIKLSAVISVDNGYYVMPYKKTKRR